MAQIRALGVRGQFDQFLDLHNPARGDREPFFFPEGDFAAPAARQDVGLRRG